MRISKIIISLLLLLIYSFGFAHNLVPHSHNFSDKNYTEIHHHQHNDGEQNNSEHNHITHDNHFDEGVYDFIICLINETDIPKTNCVFNLFFIINPNDISLKNVSAIRAAIMLFSIINPSLESQPVVKYFTDAESKYLSPLIKNSPHRGPPSFFC